MFGKSKVAEPNKGMMLGDFRQSVAVSRAALDPYAFWQQAISHGAMTASTPTPVTPTLPTRRDLAEVAEVDLGGLDRELANDVAEVFGYKVPLQTIENREAEGRLAKLLLSLDIKPFVKAEVKAYQDATVKNEAAMRRSASWESIGLGETKKKTVNWGLGGHHEYDFTYTHPIPQFALHTALRLKKAEPDCTVGIEYLDVKPADPFLYVELGNSREYVEVWDEANFNGKRHA